MKTDKRANNRCPSLPDKLASVTPFQLKDWQLTRLKADAKEYGVSAASLLRSILDDYYHDLDSQVQDQE